jgi:AcrR family transcriptional regulator
MEAEILEQPPKTGRDGKRDAILKIAFEAFLTDGYAATSMSSIAARVGGSKATLYNYFSSKEELFSAVISEKCQDIQSLLFETELEHAHFRISLLHLGERLLRLMLSDEKIAVFRLITAETARFPELGCAFYRSGPAQGKRILAESRGDRGQPQAGQYLGHGGPVLRFVQRRGSSPQALERDAGPQRRRNPRLGGTGGDGVPRGLRRRGGLRKSDQSC